MTGRDAAVTSRIMAAVKNSGTRPEMTLRRELHRRGLRYRIRTRVLGKPDIVFTRQRVAVFVDGDWWHGNAWRVRGLPSFDAQFQRHRNPDFWKHKIETNMRRDHEVTAALTAEGWRVLRFWESDLVRDIAEAADSVEAVVRQQHQSTSLAERAGL